MNAKTVILTVVLATALVWLVGCASSAPAPITASSKILKLSVAGNETGGRFKGAAKFAELVKQRTNGKYAVSVFPNNSLTSGDQNKEMELLQSGEIAFSVTTATFYANLDPRYNVTMLPWFFASNADVDKALSGPLGQELLQVVEAKNIIGLAWGEYGFRQVTNSKREIKAPEDLQGLRFRIPSTRIFESTLITLGATALKISIGDAYTAIQAGTVDGVENPIGEIVSNKFEDVQKYITVWNYSYSALVLGANKTVWAGVDADTQKIIRQAAVEAMAFQVQDNRNSEAANLKLLQDKGMKVTTLSPEQVKAFRAAVQSVYAENEVTVGKDFYNKYVTTGR